MIISMGLTQQRYNSIAAKLNDRPRKGLGNKTQKPDFFVETTGNITEEVIQKYVQNQLIELDRKEINSEQLNLF